MTFICPSTHSATNTLIELVPISKPVKKPFLAIHSTSLTFRSISYSNDRPAFGQSYSEGIIPQKNGKCAYFQFFVIYS
ncbi:hypothetical protein DK181_08160 [Streptococcus sobrinus]|nr:hypothetical protein DK181_08160 [Streptococcus sobrinus]